MVGWHGWWCALLLLYEPLGLAHWMLQAHDESAMVVMVSAVAVVKLASVMRPSALWRVVLAWLSQIVLASW